MGKAPDESKFSSGSSGTMQSKKTVQSKTHFRTIAPKVAPKVVTSCPPSFPPSVADITGSSAKPFIMQTQNYALMKVAGQDGTFSLVALPQVAPSMGGQVIQTTSIPLQENPKLPIPRYTPSREKKSLSKKSRVIVKTKPEELAVGKSEGNKEVVVKPEPKEEAVTPKIASVTTAKEVVTESNLFPAGGAQVTNVSNSALLFIDKAAPSMLPAPSPTKLSVDFEKKAVVRDGGTLVECESAKVTDSANPATVLSPVVFGSSVHLLSSVPKGKLPILPYSKIKKSIISNCKQSASPSKLPQSNVAQCGLPTSSGDAQASSSSVTVSRAPTPGGPFQPVAKPDVHLGQQNGVPSKKKGKKRKASSETLGYQTKMRLVSNKLVTCKERAKYQSAEASDKKTATVKKYRSIMPKPFVDIQGLASLGGTSSTLHSQAGESTLRNRMISVRAHRWRQNDTSTAAQSDCKIPSLSTKQLYKCHICDHSFQFKHHLQDHLNSHSNKRPYHCRLCRKAYVHSGSLSTHMKLHHSDSRLKKLMRCEFCAKVFGHIRVYFGHLKEVHCVIISTESLAKQVERKSQAQQEEANMLDRDKNEEVSLPGQTDEIHLQIKCGRCHFITPTFSDMKLHLLCVHGDEFKETLQDGVLENRQGAQEEVVKHATHHWKLLSERRNVVKCYKCNEELFGCSRLRKHVCVSDSTDSKPNETETTPSEEGPDPPGPSIDLPSGSCTEIQFCCGNVFNCLLCKKVFSLQKELFGHWETKHNCEDPLVLWTIFSSLAKTDAK